MIRDPSRIGPTIETLRAVWEKFPDMRLGQLIENACGYARSIEGHTEAEVFYMEDNEISDGLVFMLNMELE